MTITEFLLARIGEAEVVARSVPDVEPKSSASVFTSLHAPTGTVEVSPARVLAECAAKRAIVDSWRRVQSVGTNGFGPGALQHLAAVYADHPDYDEAWRP